jgi:hypothetical protein
MAAALAGGSSTSIRATAQAGHSGNFSRAGPICLRSGNPSESMLAGLVQGKYLSVDGSFVEAKHPR